MKRQDLTFWNVNLGYDVFVRFSDKLLQYNTDLEDICRDFAVFVDTEALELHRWIKRAGKELAESFINELEKNDK